MSNGGRRIQGGAEGWNIRILATGLTATVALFCSVPTEAAIINGSDFTQGESAQTIQGIDFTSSPGTFDKKTIDGFTGVGVSGGTQGEIDIGESIAGSASSFDIGSITIGFLFDGPEFGDVNEVAQITIDGTQYFLTATFANASGLNATWTGPASVSNISPATDAGAGVWLLSGLNFTGVKNIGFTAVTGACSPPSGSTCTNQSDYSLVRTRHERSRTHDPWLYRPWPLGPRCDGASPGGGIADKATAEIWIAASASVGVALFW